MNSDMSVHSGAKTSGGSPATAASASAEGNLGRIKVGFLNSEQLLLSSEQSKGQFPLRLHSTSIQEHLLKLQKDFLVHM